jgi:hypothetical protein
VGFFIEKSIMNLYCKEQKVPSDKYREGWEIIWGEDGQVSETAQAPEKEVINNKDME